MMNKLVIFGIFGAFSLTNATTDDQGVEDFASLGRDLLHSFFTNPDYNPLLDPETNDSTQIEVVSTTEFITLALETTEMQKPQTESIQMAAVTETVTVSKLAAPGVVTTETMTPKLASFTDPPTTEFIVTTEATTETLWTPAASTATAETISSELIITSLSENIASLKPNSAPSTDPLEHHIAVIVDGYKNISQSIEQECQKKSNTECDLYKCISGNFKFSDLGSLDFVQLGECFPDTLDFSDSTLNSKFFSENEFKDFINNLDHLLETRNVREIFAILDYGLSDDEKNIKSSYAGLHYAVDKMNKNRFNSEPVDLKALKMLMKSEKFNQGWNDLFESEISVSGFTEKLNVTGYLHLREIVTCGLKAYGQKQAVGAIIGSGSTEDTKALMDEGMNWIMGRSPKINLMSILINKIKNMVKDIFTVDWSNMTLSDITLKINAFRVSMGTPCVQSDIIKPIKSNINEKTGDKFGDHVVNKWSIEQSEFLTNFSKEIVPKTVFRIEILTESPNLNSTENEPSFVSKWIGNVNTDTYIIGGFVLVGMIQIVIFYIQRRNSKKREELKVAEKHEKLEIACG
jgi:hypothetical protein